MVQTAIDGVYRSIRWRQDWWSGYCWTSTSATNTQRAALSGACALHSIQTVYKHYIREKHILYMDYFRFWTHLTVTIDRSRWPSQATGTFLVFTALFLHTTPPISPCVLTSSCRLSQPFHLKKAHSTLTLALFLFKKYSHASHKYHGAPAPAPLFTCFRHFRRVISSSWLPLHLYLAILWVLFMWSIYNILLHHLYILFCPYYMYT